MFSSLHLHDDDQIIFTLQLLLLHRPFPLFKHLFPETTDHVNRQQVQVPRLCLPRLVSRLRSVRLPFRLRRFVPRRSLLRLGLVVCWLFLRHLKGVMGEGGREQRLAATACWCSSRKLAKLGAQLSAQEIGGFLQCIGSLEGCLPTLRPNQRNQVRQNQVGLNRL